jgi:ankyrin repeat protein
MLTEAVAAGQHHIVRMLIREFCADVDKPSLLGTSSPLHFAVSGSYRQIASLLITSGCDINARDMFGYTPLHLVKTYSILKLLLKFGADASLRANDGSSPSEYYKAHTNLEHQDYEFISMLTQREESHYLENNRVVKVIADADEVASVKSASNYSLVKYTQKNR